MPQNRALKEIRRLLGDVRAAIVRRALGEAVVRMLFVGLAILFVGACVLGYVQADETIRRVVWILTGIASLGVVAIRFFQVQVTYADDDQIGALVEKRFPRFRTDIRAALQLGCADDPTDERTAELRSLLVERVSEDLKTNAPSLDAAVPRTDLQPAWIAVGAVLLLGAVLHTASDGFRDGTRTLLTGVVEAFEPDADEADRRPIVSTVDLEIFAPAYTGLPPSIVRHSTGDIRAVEGSNVLIRATALETARSGTIIVQRGDEEEERLSLDVTNGTQLRGEVQVTAQGTYTFEIERMDGTVVTDPFPRAMIVDRDHPPRIELSAPAGNLNVSPSDVIDFSYVITDDFGLSDVSLGWYFAGDEDDIRYLPLHGSASGQTVSDTAPLDLAPMILQPRDEVIAFVEATDNNTATGPRTTRSRRISMVVSSPEDLNEEVLHLKEQLFEAMLTQLGGMLTTQLNEVETNEDLAEIALVPVAGDGPTLSSLVRDATAVRDRWPDLLAEFRALLELMEQDELTIVRDLELLQASYDALYETERNVAQVLDRLALAASNDRVTQSAFNRVAEEDAELTTQTERTTLLLEDLIASQQADGVERTLEQIDNLRDRLRELLEEYQETNDPELREQIERELARLQERLNELLQRLASQMQDLPYEHLNMEALEQSDSMQNIDQMVSAMDQIQQMLDAGDIEGALQALDNLGENLDSLAGEFGANMQSGGSDQLSEFDREMAELMEQVNDLEMAEQDLEQATNELQEEMRRERQEEIREQVEQRMSELRTMLDEFERRFTESERGELSQGRREMLEELNQGLERMDQMLQEGDIAGAEEQADAMLSRFGDAARDLRTDEALLRPDPTARRQAGQMRGLSNEGADLMEEMGRQLREMMQLAEPRPGPGQRARMDELAQEQGQIGEQLQGLQEQVEEFSQRFPAGEQLGEPLEQVGESMRGAEGELRNGQPQQALRGEQSALEGLRQLRQQMQQMTRRQNQREQQQRGNTSEEDVEIPEENDRGRAEYRQQIMDAMHEESLESYDDEIRSYYERLVE